MMYRSVLITTFAAVVSAQTPYSDFCLQNQFGADQQNHFPDPSDCHYYIHCDIFNSTLATGTRVKCPEGQFWQQRVVSCVPEGAIPCIDRCLMEIETFVRGCYAGTGCRQFFACYLSVSYGMCCPDGTSFVESTCTCEESTTCNDICVQAGPATATTVKPVQVINATVCRDSFGAIISTVPGEDNAYILLTEEGVSTAKQYCATGTLFDFTTCRCGIEDPNAAPPPITPWRKPFLILTFDSDTKDSSPNKFETYLYNGAKLDIVNAARGTGSLAVNGGFLTVPGTKSIDLSRESSVCFFFRGTSGGLFSDSRDSTNEEFFVRIGLTSPNNIATSLNSYYPKVVLTIDTPFPNDPNSWNHYCAVYRNKVGTIYLNGQSGSADLPSVVREIAFSPLLVGNDPAWGSLNGNIDEVIAADFAFTPEEIELHRAGNYAALNFN